MDAARRFRYCFDPMCVASLLLYAANRWCIKPSICLGQIRFFHDHLNDVLCIPLFLPAVLLNHRILRLRLHDKPPTPTELLVHLAIWSVCFELIAPHMPTIYRTTADPLDVAAYALGTAIAGLAWGSWADTRIPLLSSGLRWACSMAKQRRVAAPPCPPHCRPGIPAGDTCN